MLYWIVAFLLYGPYVDFLRLNTLGIMLYLSGTIIFFKSLLFKSPLYTSHSGRSSLYSFAIVIVSFYALIITFFHSGLFTKDALGQINRLGSIPLIIILISRLKDLNRFYKTVLLVLSLMSFITLLDLFSVLNDPFAHWSPQGESTADRALKMGRYVGPFITPFEAGVTYGSAILCLPALRNEINKNLYRTIALLLFIGGMLSVSKAFLIAIIFIGLGKLSLRGMIYLGSSVFLLSLLDLRIGEYWDGWYRIEMFYSVLTEGGDVLGKLSGNRYGGKETISATIYENQIGFYGRGFGDYGVLDNGFLEILFIAGLIGIVVYIFYYLVFIKYEFLWYYRQYFFVVLFLFLINFGGPVLLRPKAFFIVHLTLIYLYKNAKSLSG